MQYYYKLGYTGLESKKTILTHCDKIENSEFEQMVLKSYSIADKNVRNSYKQWCEDSKNSDIEYKSEIILLYPEVIDIMKSKYGFQELKIESSFISYNSSDILNEDEIFEESLLKIKKRIKSFNK